jgi:hypothetical protein
VLTTRIWWDEELVDTPPKATQADLCDFIKTDEISGIVSGGRSFLITPYEITVEESCGAGFECSSRIALGTTVILAGSDGRGKGSFDP